MRSAILRDLQAALNHRRVVGIWRRRIEKPTLRGVVLGVNPDLVLLQVLDDGIRLDGYSVIRTRDISRIDLLLPYARFYHAALRLRGQRPRPPRRIDLRDLAAVIMTAGMSYPLVTVHPERKDPGICWIGRPLRIERRDLILAYITPDATWDGEQRCRLADITRVDFGRAYEEALALVADDRATKRVRRRATSGRRLGR